MSADCPDCIEAERMAECLRGICEHPAHDRDISHNARIAALEAQVAAVEALHKPVPIFNPAEHCADPNDHEHDEDDYGELICRHCGVLYSVCDLCTDEYGDFIDHPCSTVRALHPEDQP